MILKKPEEIKKLVRADFESGKLPITEVAKKRGVSRSFILKWEKAEKWSRKNRPKRKKSKPKKKKSAGRPPKYKAEYNKQATALCVAGYTNEQLAEFFDIQDSTFYDWQNKHNEFSEAIRAGRDKATAKAGASLFQRVTGFGYQEIKEEHEDGVLVKKTVMNKRALPDVRAAEIYLKAKKPEHWNKPQQIEASVKALIGEITEEDAKKVKDLFDEITE